MASWIGLAFLILLSANAVFGDTPYTDQIIEDDNYLRNCIISSGLQDREKEGVKEFHTNSQCYAKTTIKFKVEAGSGSSFLMQNRQEQDYVLPAKIKYKFGQCDGIEIGIDKDNNDEVKYTLPTTDGGTEVVDAFDLLLVRRPKNQFGKPDTMEVRTNNNPVFSKQCNAFERDQDPQDAEVPTLLLFEQEVVSGVPDLTLLWNVWLKKDGYFGAAHAKEIIDVGTTTSTTTTTVKPPPAPVTKPSTKVSTSSPVPSTSSLPTTVAPTTDLVVEESEEEAFPWWIILVAVGVALVLLIILLVVGYFCCRRRRAQKSQAQGGASVVASVKKVQEKSESAADKMYFERDAKPTDPKAVSKEAASKEAASKKSTSKEIASK